MVAMAWISSTITVSTPRSVSAADDVSIRYSDSGVVISRSGGRRISRLTLVGRCVAGAHRHLGRGERRPRSVRQRVRSRPAGRAGSSRRRTPAPAAARCTAPACGACGASGCGVVTSRSIEARKAVSVLPRPGRRTDQRVLARGDVRPALDLGRGRRRERRREPFAHRRRERLEDRMMCDAAESTEGVSRPIRTTA